MDVLSEKGLRYDKMARHAINAAKDQHPNLRFAQTPITWPAAVDYILFLEGGEMTGVMEIKVRETGINFHELMEDQKPLFLSVDKFNKGVQLADLLGVPFFFWIYLPGNMTLLSYKLYDPETGKFAEFSHQITSTRKSTNDKTTRTKPIIAIRGSQGLPISINIDPLE